MADMGRRMLFCVDSLIDFFNERWMDEEERGHGRWCFAALRSKLEGRHEFDDGMG